MRLIVSAPTENPIVWSVTKIENFKPIGIQKLTLYQDFYDSNVDYIKYDKNGNIIAMYANFYDYDESEIQPTDSSVPTLVESNIHGEITASTSTIKVGGSYKTLSLHIYDSHNTDVTDEYSQENINWSCDVDGISLYDLVTWKTCNDFNQIKIKFPDDRQYLGKVLNVKCTVGNIEVVERFSLLNK